MKKKKKNKYINIMIIPDSNHEVKNLKISIPFLKITMISILTILLSLGTLSIYSLGQNTYLYESLKQKDAKIADLTKINSQQENKIAVLDKNAQLISEKIKNLNELEDKVMRMVGLSSTKTSRGNITRDSRNTSSISYDENTTTQLASEIDQKSKDLENLMAKVSDRLNYLNSIPSIYPVYGTITSPFGMRKSPYGYGSEFHPGIDIAVPVGTPVKAAGSGTVTYAGWLSGYGKAIMIDHGYGITSVYGHNSEILVKVGQTVKRGDIIAKSGNTGRSTGPHVHFEVRLNGNPIDPMKYLAKEN
ncbi:MAG: M23 family metallopeptidase [Minisyncoccia bacterium]